MILVQKGYLTFVILIISFLTHESSAGVRTGKFIGLRYKTQLIESYYKPGSTHFVFGTCDPRSRSWEKSCTFAIETKKAVVTEDHVKICDFKIRANYTNSEFIGQILEVHDFGDDKAILIYKGKYDFIRFSILNFSNCEAVVSKIDENLNLRSATVLATGDGIFDVVERKYGKSCGHFAFMKMILDDEGNIITGLNEWLCNENPHILAAMYSPLKGHLIVDAASMLQKNVRVMEVNQNLTVLKEFSNYESFSSTVAISSTHKKLSICYQVSLLRFNCSQYDHNGGLIFETSFEFQRPTRSANLYNLPNGEILLLAQESIRDDRIAFSKTQPNNLVVLKMNGQENLIKIADLSSAFNDAVDFTQIHFHIDEYNLYCFSSVFDSSLVQIDKLVHLAIVCLDDDDFIGPK